VVAGGIFLFFALVISVGRLFIGAHYPGDVAAGLLVGLAASLVITKLARPAVVFLVRRVQRLTDPVLAPLWRLRAR
jgi:membrane-associated phospholipid phosphatase